LQNDWLIARAVSKEARTEREFKPGEVAMKSKRSGFTLIELLLVVAIIGILSSLLIPNVMIAIQKSKQKSCMKEIIFMATGCTDFIVDRGSWETIDQDGPLLSSGPFVEALYSYRLKQFPVHDPWGTAYWIHVGPEAVAGAISGIPADDCGWDDFLIHSLGRDAEAGPTYDTYDEGDPQAGFYTLVTIADFDEDLVNWSGSWIIAPRVAREQPGS
jgi:general secretion pathway protein G